MGKKSEILDNVREGLAYEITNKLLWDNHKCERLYDTIRYNIKVLLSKSYCDWMTINETVKLLEELGVEFREGVIMFLNKDMFDLELAERRLRSYTLDLIKNYFNGLTDKEIVSYSKQALRHWSEIKIKNGVIYKRKDGFRIVYEYGDKRLECRIEENNEILNKFYNTVEFASRHQDKIERINKINEFLNEVEI